MNDTGTNWKTLKLETVLSLIETLRYSFFFLTQNIDYYFFILFRSMQSSNIWKKFEETNRVTKPSLLVNSQGNLLRGIVNCLGLA